MAKSSITKKIKVCKVEGCGRKHNCKGYCRAHYERLVRRGTVASSPIRHRRSKDEPLAICKVVGCKEYTYGKGLCSQHHSRLTRGIPLDARHKYALNEYIIKEQYAEILLCNRKLQVINKTLIDTGVIEKCRPYHWNIDRRNYVYGKVDGKRIHLARFLLGIGDKSMCSDHINRNPLDNRMVNLRICSHSQNTMNANPTSNSKSGYKGVFFTGKHYAAIVHASGKRHYSPGLTTAKEAAIEYNRLAKQYHGAFACPNIIQED